MILTGDVARAVAAGDVNVAYRRWARPRVQADSTFRTVAGVVRIDSVTPVSVDELSDEDARRAGYESLDELIGTFRGRSEDAVFRVGLSWVGADERDALAGDADLKPEDIADIDALLERLDARTPWAWSVLNRIREEPGITVGLLAAEVGIQKDSLKRRVRTLKEHGLTRSLRVGYALSERGQAYLGAVGPR